MSQTNWQSKKPKEEFLAFCHVCKVKLKAEQASVLRERHERQLIHADCHRCGSSVLILLTPAPYHPFYATVVMLTDMTKQDVRRSFRLRALTPDDVLEFHRSLKKQNLENRI